MNVFKYKVFYEGRQLQGLVVVKNNLQAISVYPPCSDREFTDYEIILAFQEFQGKDSVDDKWKFESVCTPS